MTAESTIAAAHRDPGDPKYIVPAANILACHNNNRVEANITGAVRDFLLLTNPGRNCASGCGSLWNGKGGGALGGAIAATSPLLTPDTSPYH